MKYRVLETIRFKTPKGDIELHPGQVTVLHSDVAIRLISEGKITPIGMVAYKIHSKILGDDLWIVATDRELQDLVDESIKETIYTQEEVSRMIDEDVSKEGLAALHKVKGAFPAATVEDIESEQQKI
jgi:hypothetical protein